MSDDKPQGTDAERTDVHTDGELVAPASEVARSETEVLEVRHGMFGVHGTGDTSGYGGLNRPVTFPGATSRPYGGWFDEVADAAEDALAHVAPDGPFVKVVVHNGEITFHIDRAIIRDVCQVFRDDERLRFELCSAVSGVHYPHEAGGELHAVYHLLSMTHNRRVRLETSAPDADPHVPSVVPVYPTADWHERETFDLMGIIFDGHPALTRIQMPDDWPGHPQRKDYPLGGIPVEYKGGTVPPPDQRRSYN